MPKRLTMSSSKAGSWKALIDVACRRVMSRHHVSGWKRGIPSRNSGSTMVACPWHNILTCRANRITSSRAQEGPWLIWKRGNLRRRDTVSWKEASRESTSSRFSKITSPYPGSLLWLFRILFCQRTVHPLSLRTRSTQFSSPSSP